MHAAPSELGLLITWDDILSDFARLSSDLDDTDDPNIVAFNASEVPRDPAVATAGLEVTIVARVEKIIPAVGRFHESPNCPGGRR